MNTMLSSLAKFVVTCVALTTSAAVQAQVILVKPYIQPGDGGSLGAKDAKVVMWLTDQVPGDFAVEYGPPGGGVTAAKVTRIALDFKPAEADAKGVVPPNLANLPKSETPPQPAVAQHYFRYSASLENLALDSHVQYRVKLKGAVVREAEFRTRASGTKPIRFIMVGDLADGKPFQNEVAFRISKTDPDFMVLLGDIVYPAGRVSQYMDHFWRTYCNPDTANPTTGAPLMATIPFYPALGNHDVAARLTVYPDALGAFYFFSVPTGGPGEGPWNTPLGSDEAAASAFRSTVGNAYPSIGFYSFDDGPAHFLVLDSTDYVPVGAARLAEWLARDLKDSKSPWKFVCFHTPAFETSQEHYTEQKMRLLEPVFEKYGVDVVFAGHVHNYQRSKPLRFKPRDPTRREPRGTVTGTFTLDEKFDGITNTRPDGIIHIVSGGGGAHLYATNEKTIEAVKKANGPNWGPFTAKYFSEAHCFTVVEVTPMQFHLRALTDKGEPVDEITIDKPAGATQK